MTTPARITEERGIIAKRRGQNTPITMCGAAHDGHRSVRVEVDGRMIGLATAAYSYLLTDEEKVETARRMAALWTLAALKGWSTGHIECAIDAEAAKP